MELKVVKSENKLLLLEFLDETYTFTNLLKEELWRDKNVSEAAEIKEHPYLENLKLLVKVKRGNPKEAVEKAIKRLKEKVEKLAAKLEKKLENA